MSKPYTFKTHLNEQIRVTEVHDKIRFEKIVDGYVYETIDIQKQHLVSLIGNICYYLVENKIS